MTYLFFDTETTGLPNKRLSYVHTDQPHICQLAAIEVDSDRRTMTEINFLIRPDGWTIPEEASAIHGITQSSAERYGIKIEGALSIMRRLISRSSMVIAHNIEFDAWMLRRELAAVSDPAWDWGGGREFCTLKESQDIVKCPPTERMLKAGITGYKKPTLTETYRHFFGRDFEGAHDAMADVRACRDVFFKLMDLDAVTAPEVAA